MWCPVYRLPLRPSTMNYGLFPTIAISSIAFIFLLKVSRVPRVLPDQRPAVSPPPRDQSGSQVSCRRLFGLSESRMFWEQPSADAPAVCDGSGLLPEHASPCLTRLRRRRGRPAHVMFIGDSRARILFMKVRETLKLPWRRQILHDDFHSKENATFLERGQRLRCPRSIKMFHKTEFVKWVCYLEALNDLVRATFYWTPCVSRGYVDRLTVVEEDCRNGLACPDLIVMTVGMWHAKTDVGRLGLALSERPLHFANELEKLVPVLRSLSDHTQPVYRLDGPDFTEGSGNKSNLNGVILAINAVAMTTLQKVPGLQLWSSSLAETIRFQHTVCLQLASFHTPVLGKQGHECLDENHVGETVRRSAAGAVIRYLCRDTERHPTGHCCDTSV